MILDFFKRNWLLVALIALGVLVLGLVAHALGYSPFSGLISILAGIFGGKKPKEEIKPEEQASDGKDKALVSAGREQDKINKNTRIEIQTIRDKEQQYRRSITDPTSKEDADRQMQDAINRSKRDRDPLKKNGIIALLFLFLPLQGCFAAHGSGSGNQSDPEWVQIRKTTWKNAIETIEQCNADRLVLQSRIKQGEQIATVRCDARIKVCRADLTACRQQKAAIRCTECTFWKVMVGILAATTAAGIGWGIYEHMRAK